MSFCVRAFLVESCFGGGASNSYVCKRYDLECICVSGGVLVCAGLCVGVGVGDGVGVGIACVTCW